MKTSYYETSVVTETWTDNELVDPEEVTVRTVETLTADCVETSVTSDEQPIVDPISEYYTASSDVSLLSESDLPDRCQEDPVERGGKGCVPVGRGIDTNYTASSDVSLLSESDMPDRSHDDPTDKGCVMAGRPVDMYYTASSDVSLLSEPDLPDRCQEDPIEREEKGCVMAGHVAAMRERFESMTRANTPCPELARSLSPTLDVFRVTPSPDGLG